MIKHTETRVGVCVCEEVYLLEGRIGLEIEVESGAAVAGCKEGMRIRDWDLEKEREKDCEAMGGAPSKREAILQLSKMNS